VCLRRSLDLSNNLLTLTMFRRRTASPPDIRLRVEGRDVTFSDIASFSRDIITGSFFSGGWKIVCCDERSSLVICGINEHLIY